MDLKSLITTKKIIGLSPMDGITDEPFRLLQTKIAKPDIIFTEFASAEGISRGGVKLYDQLLYSSLERPIIGQLFGKDPDSFYKAAVILCHLGFDGIDINMGCPAKTVTHHGSGGALIDQPALAAAIIQMTKKGITDFRNLKTTLKDLNLNQKTQQIVKRNLKYSKYTPTTDNYHPTISVKTRLGIDKIVTDTWIPHLLDQGLDFISLHGRTLRQGYSGNANWDQIAAAAILAHQKNTPLWGNGDIISRIMAVDYQQKYGVDGVLIGRAAMGNPWVFGHTTPNFRLKFKTMLLHAQIYQKVFPNRRFDPLRKHFLLYASGHPRAKKLRAGLVAVNNLNDLLRLEDRFSS